MTGTASALLPQGACGTTAAEDDGLGIPHILTISREARAAAWNRYQPPPPPPIVPRDVEVARAAEKKRRAYARIAKLKAKKATATATAMAVTMATTTTITAVVTRIPAGILADERWPGMYRVKLGRSQLSDMLNLTRARDVLASRG